MNNLYVLVIISLLANPASSRMEGSRPTYQYVSSYESSLTQSQFETTRLFTTSLPTTTSLPSISPSGTPSTNNPTTNPTISPTNDPSFRPSVAPSSWPSESPSEPPTKEPTYEPTPKPSSTPTYKPTTSKPTPTPSKRPTTAIPSAQPTHEPTYGPTPEPLPKPSSTPSTKPTTSKPTPAPSRKPTTSKPTTMPTSSPSVSSQPSRSPSMEPSVSIVPTITTSSEPSISSIPTIQPTYEPTMEPSYSPSQSPTQSPIVGTRSPTVFPSVSPSVSKHPTFTPSNSPTTSMLDGPIRTTGLTLTLFGLDFINETEWEQITSNSFSEFYTSGPDLEGARAEVSITDIKWDPGSLLRGRRRMNGGIRGKRFLQSESSMKVVYAQELYYSSRKPTSTSTNSQLATYPLSTTSNRESYYTELRSLPGYKNLISVSGISLPYDAPLFDSPPAQKSNVGLIVGGLFAAIIIVSLIVYVYQLKVKKKMGMKSVCEAVVLPNVDNSRRVDEDYSHTYGVGEILRSSDTPGDESVVTFDYGYKYAQEINNDATTVNCYERRPLYSFGPRQNYSK
jgi:hypothetical protein